MADDTNSHDPSYDTPSAPPEINFAKIVSTPTYFSWSQAYSAGSVFAVVSLTKTKDTVPVSTDEQTQELLLSLPAVGKEILNALEQEYFTLETKDLDSIKKAVSETLKRLPEAVTCSISLAAFIKNVLYLVMVGNGVVILKRGDATDVVLSQEDSAPDAMISSSGFVEDKDIILLETEQFARILPLQELTASLDHLPPSEIAESLSPKIHKTEEGGASCIIVSYTNPHAPEKPPPLPESPPLPKHPLIQTVLAFFTKRLNFSLPRLRFPKSQVSLIGIAFFIILLILGGIVFSIKNREAVKRKALFEEVRASAQKKYDEGQSLLGLNRNVAREDFSDAKNIIQNKLDAFPSNSKEREDLETLSQQIDEAILASLNASRVSPQKTDTSASLLLKEFIAQKNVLFATQNEENLFVVTDKEIASVSKKTETRTSLIKREWSKAGGIGVFGSNLYLLDKDAHKVYKYIPQGTSYTKSDYLAIDVTPDFSNVSDMAVDGAVWVLYLDGRIHKFLRGKAESFAISGLDEPFKNPLGLVTNQDSSLLYILDPGNQTIIALSKEGKYEKQYSSDVFKTAKALDIRESEGKGFVTDGSSLFEFPLK